MSIADDNARQSEFYADNERVDAGPDPETYTLYARDVEVGMLVDFTPLYRFFGEAVPDWSLYEYGEVVDVLGEDIVTIYTFNDGIALPRDFVVTVCGERPDHVEDFPV